MGTLTNVSVHHNHNFLGVGMGVEVSSACKKKQTSCSQCKRVPSSRFWGVPWILHFDPDPRAVLRQGFPGTFSETQVWWSVPQAQEGMQRRLALQKELR